MSSFQFFGVGFVDNVHNRAHYIILQLKSISFLVQKIKFPCLAPKKRAHNCELALESFARSGVLLEDETGASITAEHISSGQREKTLSLIWNLILYLQVHVSRGLFWLLQNPDHVFECVTTTFYI